MDELLRRLIVSIDYVIDPSQRDAVRREEGHLQARAVAIGTLAAAGIEKLASLAVGAATSLARFAVSAVEGFAELGGEIADTAAKAGVTTDELQRLRYAAKLSSVEAATLTGGLRELQKGLVEARTKGSGPMVDGLGLLGVELRELEGLSTEDQLALLADAMRGITDPAERTAAALKVFGGAGQDLVPLLAQGGDGIKALTARASELGIVLDRATIATSEELGDTLDTLGLQAKAAGGRVVAALVPAITAAGQRVSEWAEANRPFLEQDLPAYFAAILEVGGDLLAWVADVLSEFRQFGREVGFLADEVSEFAGMLRSELQPAIDAIASVVSTWADAFSTVNSAIGDGIAAVLDYIGVLDKLRAAWDSLPFLGESVDDLTDRLHGRRASGRGHAGFLGAENEAARVEAATARNTAATLALAAAQRVAAEAALAATLGTPDRSAARDRYARAARAGGGGGGGGKSSGAAAASLSALWGGLTGQREETWLDRTGAALGDALGFGASRPMPHASAGGSPLAGASFSRVDASVSINAPVTVTVPAELVAQGGAAYLERVASIVRDAIDDRGREIADHYASTARRL